jgi:hypothetical protein
LPLDAVRHRTIGLAVGFVLAVGLFGVPVGADAAAANCKLTLQAGQASPASGTTQTETTFSVRVSWKASCGEPSAVRVTVLGLSGSIQLGGGSLSTSGGTSTAVYSGKYTIGTPGSWGYEFSARLDPADPWVTLEGSSPGQIDIAAVPDPEPTPKPTPKPKPSPTPTPKPKPKPKPTPTPTPTPKPKPTPTREPQSAPTPDPTADPSVEPTPESPTAPPPESSEPTTPVESEAPGFFPTAPVPSDDAPAPTSPPRTAGGLLFPAGPDDPPGPNLPPPPAAPLPSFSSALDLALLLFVWVASASVGTVLFVVALRRRAGHARESNLAFAVAMADAGRGLPPAPDEIAEAHSEAPAAAPDPEAQIPRWRRPSLQAARQSSFADAGTSRLPLRFPEDAAVGALRIVAYRLVFVSDRPTEQEAVELGRLDRGDEVDLLRMENGFALVKAPDGMRGWVDVSTLMPPPNA